MDARLWKRIGFVAAAILVAFGPFCFVWWKRTHEHKPIRTVSGKYEAHVEWGKEGPKLFVTQSSDGSVVAFAPANMKDGEEGQIVWTKDQGACGLRVKRRERWTLVGVVRISDEYAEMTDDDVWRRFVEANP